MATSDNSESVNDLYIYPDIGGFRYEISKKSFEQPSLKSYINNLIQWVQNLVHYKGLVVRNLEDITNVIILSTLLSECAHIEYNVALKPRTFQQTIDLLDELLMEIEKVITYKTNMVKWNSLMLYHKYLPAIIHLTTALYIEFDKSVDYHLIGRVELPVTSITKLGVRLTQLEVFFDVSSIYDKIRNDDVIELLYNNPDKWIQFKDGILKFVKKNLDPMERQIVNFTTSFTDGVNLILLCACVGNFFIPFNAFEMKPTAKGEMESNVEFLFELLRDLKIQTSFVEIKDILNGNEKATLKLIYTLINSIKVN